MPEHRRARRIVLHVPTVVEVVSQPEVKLPAAVERVYSRVESDKSALGERHEGEIRDLSTNGAFIATVPVPLLSRLAFRFDFEGTRVDALAWVMWRRDADCAVTDPGGEPVVLPRGVGVLFESVPLDARLAIARAVAS
jgi:hypothetical protein